MAAWPSWGRMVPKSVNVCRRLQCSPQWNQVARLHEIQDLYSKPSAPIQAILTDDRVCMYFYLSMDVACMPG